MARKRNAVVKTGDNFREEFCTAQQVRERVFAQLKRHILDGYSLDCFGPLSEYEIREALKNYPSEFKSRELEEVVREAKAGWELIGRSQAEGTCLGNSRSWFYNMSNRYGWSDKQKVETSGASALTVSIVDYASTRTLCTTTENTK